MERVTLDERESIAFKYRSFILDIKDPEKLAIEAETKKPHPEIAGAYAFEWILDQMRVQFRTAVKGATDYEMGWVSGSLEKDDEFRTPEKISRIATAVFVNKSQRDGLFKDLARKIAELIESRSGGLTTRSKLEGFCYEVIVELFAEYAREQVQ